MLPPYVTELRSRASESAAALQLDQGMREEVHTANVCAAKSAMNLHSGMVIITRLVAKQDGEETAVGLIGPILDYLYGGELPYGHPRRANERLDEERRLRQHEQW